MIKIKEGFKGQRLLSLPKDLLMKYSCHPLVGELYVCKIGFFPKVKYHYVQKSEGTNYYLLIYCTGGKGWYKIHDKEYEITAHQYVILPQGTPYTLGADVQNPWTIYWLHFEGRLAGNFIHDKFDPVVLDSGYYSRLQDRLELFEEIYSNFSFAYIQEYMIQASMCLYPFLSSFLYMKQFKHYRLGHTKDQTFSMQVIRYMQENIGDNLSLPQLAANFKYSVSHFSALFQKETGIAPMNYYLQLRIRKACEYIELTSLKLAEIALKVGFDEPAYFSRIFTKFMGVPPSQYRWRENLQ